jgi:hypothetical protein
MTEPYDLFLDDERHPPRSTCLVTLYWSLRILGFPV